MATIEITLEQLMQDYNWSEVFADTNAGNVSKETTEAPPGAKVDTTPPNREDVAEIIAAVNGDNDGPDWVGLFRLKDGRYLVASGGCDYTGWDCQAGNRLIVCATLTDALVFGLSEPECERLGLQRPTETPATPGAPSTNPPTPTHTTAESGAAKAEWPQFFRHTLSLNVVRFNSEHDAGTYVESPSMIGTSPTASYWHTAGSKYWRRCEPVPSAVTTPPPPSASPAAPTLTDHSTPPLQGLGYVANRPGYSPAEAVVRAEAWVSSLLTLVQQGCSLHYVEGYTIRMPKPMPKCGFLDDALRYRWTVRYPTPQEAVIEAGRWMDENHAAYRAGGAK